ncbi:hypothetical protein [Mesorhizobium sp.]|nr:hypothetical protein [Mesorhizobium sp.]
MITIKIWKLMGLDCAQFRFSTVRSPIRDDAIGLASASAELP